jgi:hypothetical protein
MMSLEGQGVRCRPASTGEDVATAKSKIILHRAEITQQHTTHNRQHRGIGSIGCMWIVTLRYEYNMLLLDSIDSAAERR